MTYDLILGDCLEVMPTLEAGSVDAIICDLPYGVTACAWDSVIPLEPLWAQYKRLLKPRGAVVLTATQPFTTTLIMSNREWFRYSLIWDKIRPGGFLDSKRRPMKRHEDVCIFYDRQSTYNPQMTPRNKPYVHRGNHNKEYGGAGTSPYGKRLMVPGTYEERYPTSIMTISTGSQGIKQHPTQKPVALGEYLIRTYTNPGDLVLDNTTGSGSFGVAALNTGRRFIGIERDEGYYNIAVERMAKAAGEPRQEPLELERVS